MVKPERLGLGMAYFKSLSVPFGFTPVMWDALVKQGSVSLIGVMDANASLQMVIKQRADGADIEYHVASHLLKILNQPEALKLDLSLPYTLTDFQLSTIKHQKILAELNTYIQLHPKKVALLKARYQLESPQDIIKNHSFPAVKLP